MHFYLIVGVHLFMLNMFVSDVRSSDMWLEIYAWFTLYNQIQMWVTSRSKGHWMNFAWNISKYDKFKYVFWLCIPYRHLLQPVLLHYIGIMLTCGHYGQTILIFDFIWCYHPMGFMNHCLKSTMIMKHELFLMGLFYVFTERK